MPSPRTVTPLAGLPTHKGMGRQRTRTLVSQLGDIRMAGRASLVCEAADVTDLLVVGVAGPEPQ